jgi:hypothetical protein
MRASERLIERWAHAGLSIMPGASEHALQAFEAKHNMALPADFRGYLAHVGGDALDACMGNCGAEDYYIFWSLDRVRSVRDECGNGGDLLPHGEDPQQHFIFADWLLWSHAYAICLGARQSGRIAIVASKDHRRFVADSFTEFVDAYLRDPAQPIY